MRAIIVLIALATGVCGCTGEFPHDPVHLRAATDSYNQHVLSENLDRIKAWHSSNKTGSDLELRAGLPESALSPKLFTDQCRLTRELKSLWSWHDGGSKTVPLIWYHDFLSLEDAIAEYKWLILNPLVQWDPSYIPIMSFEGEWYAAYCGNTTRVAGPIVHYFLEDGARLTAVNLTTFIATMAQVLDAGAIRWEDEAMVEDIRQVSEIHRANNPGYEFPYYVPDGP